MNRCFLVSGGPLLCLVHFTLRSSPMLEFCWKASGRAYCPLNSHSASHGLRPGAGSLPGLGTLPVATAEGVGTSLSHTNLLQVVFRISRQGRVWLVAMSSHEHRVLLAPGLVGMCLPPACPPTPCRHEPRLAALVRAESPLDGRLVVCPRALGTSPQRQPWAGAWVTAHGLESGATP